MQSLPGAQAWSQPPPEHEKTHVAFSPHVCLQLEPEQKKLHVAPAGQVWTQPLFGQVFSMTVPEPPELLDELELVPPSAVVPPELDEAPPEDEEPVAVPPDELVEGAGLVGSFELSSIGSEFLTVQAARASAARPNERVAILFT